MALVTSADTNAATEILRRTEICQGQVSAGYIEERFLSARADAFAGSEREEKALLSE
jgi:hypothetical protein